MHQLAIRVIDEMVHYQMTASGIFNFDNYRDIAVLSESSFDFGDGIV
jgi:hypothetical protein